MGGLRGNRVLVRSGIGEIEDSTAAGVDAPSDAADKGDEEDWSAQKGALVSSGWSHSN